jgi:hypothetical protein
VLNIEADPGAAEEVGFLPEVMVEFVGPGIIFVVEEIVAFVVEAVIFVVEGVKFLPEVVVEFVRPGIIFVVEEVEFLPGITVEFVGPGMCVALIPPKVVLVEEVGPRASKTGGPAGGSRSIGDPHPLGSPVPSEEQGSSTSRHTPFPL